MLILGIAGCELTWREREQLAAPQVSGAILFKRNYASRAQATDLIAAMREVRGEDFIVCVDQEGGPVQRFQGDGFTRLPALASIGDIHDVEPARAVRLAEEHAWLMAAEMRAIDIDLSLAPVLDLRRGNRAVGRRAFAAQPETVSALGLAYLRGLHLAGMAATLKHFPGHGTVAEDTHVDAATDARTLAQLRADDLVPFADAIGAGAEAVMMAHVVYPAVDALPAGQSRVWIQDILRGEYGFRGIVFSDDISMAAAGNAGDVAPRIAAHRRAGCDLILVCQPQASEAALVATHGENPIDRERLAALRGGLAQTWASMLDDPQRAKAIARIMALDADKETA